MMTTLALTLLQLTPEARAAGGMDAASWAFMLGSMGAVTGLTVWCFARILRGKQHFDPDGTGPADPPVAGRLEREDGR